VIAEHRKLVTIGGLRTTLVAINGARLAPAIAGRRVTVVTIAGSITS
jgi:hypothetical protein